MDPGRDLSRSPVRTGRGRDYIPHASEDWERRRSRSPVRRGGTWEPDLQLRGQPVSPDPLVDLCRGVDVPVWGWRESSEPPRDPAHHLPARGSLGLGFSWRRP
jgi:hypothetical protein